jgi:O-Antigen ligase
VAGPYSHAILAGIMLAVAFILQRWLHTASHWEPRFVRLKALPWSKAWVITAVLAVGMLMTVARGPWLGALAAVALLAAGQAVNRKRALKLAGASLAIGAAAVFWILSDYLDIEPGAAMTMSQESALYRKLLFEKYFDIAMDSAWLGWGLTTWPKVRGMESIDNYYLLISLMHGVPAMAMLVTMLLASTAQCLRRALAEAAGVRGPGFAFAGVFMAVFVSLGTVYLGEQVLPMLFFMLGWAQGWLRTPLAAPAQPAGGAVPTAMPVRPAFRHVIQ